ncbi:hypothetical protein L210DRAFT_950580 [Boletus edulis BED1]|uniref:Uncharacterized protein n=1 Tax=Boletus edulis BED1 TaxID=1328754 RepID=A0AAD4BB04_BOLED|nr:hypothetical protein L210DRAFT_3582457 [Boletus edulis BED1]KAF8427106.1 hypothetical protein L210DRAFT_950580 [Boletus edulis BED1]
MGVGMCRSVALDWCLSSGGACALVLPKYTQSPRSTSGAAIFAFRTSASLLHVSNVPDLASMRSNEHILYD